MTASTRRKTPPAYRFEAYDQHICLKPSLPMLLAMLYSVHHWLLVFVLYFPLMMVDTSALKHLMSNPLSGYLLAAESPALLLFLSWWMRQPKAAAPWRWLWRNGRRLLFLTLLSQALLLIASPSGRQWLGEAQAPLLVYLPLHAWVLAYVIMSRRLADVFLDYPAPPPAAKPKRRANPSAPAEAPTPDTTLASAPFPTEAQAQAAAARFIAADAPGQADTLRRLALETTDSAALWYHLGQQAIRQDAWEEAAALVAMAARRDSRSGRYLSALCEIQRRRGRIADALEAGRKAVQRQPDAVSAHYNLALALADAGQTRNAITSYQSALRLDPAHARAWNNLGVLYLQDGKLGPAQQAFTRAVDLAPKLAEAKKNLSALSLKGID